MTKEQYIKMREESSIEIMYNYYIENFDKNKHNPLLGISEFIQFMRLWPNNQQAFNVATDYYDVKFNVLRVPLEDKMMFI